MTQALVCALHKHTLHHLRLQLVADACPRFAIGRAIEPINLLTGKGFRLRGQWSVIIFSNKLRHVFARTSPKYNQIYQRVCSQTVRAVYRDTGHFTSCIEAWQRCPLCIEYHACIHIRWNTAHRVVCCRLDWHWLSNWLNTQVIAREVRDIWQFLSDDLRT